MTIVEPAQEEAQEPREIPFRHICFCPRPIARPIIKHVDTDTQTTRVPFIPEDA